MENNTTIRRLGDFICEVNERNSNGFISLSQGICNLKYFQNPRQVSATPELDKIVRTGQFAYNRATTRNGDKISIALREGPDCTVSSAYCVFYITDENVIDPHWLWLWFKRPDFDRYAIFKSHGSAHEFFEFETMCNVKLSVPPIEEQRAIVARHRAIEHKIDVNHRLIAALEETARTIYRHTFIDNIDPENLPQGWRIGTISEIIDETLGGDWGKDEPIGNYLTKVRCLRGADITSARNGNITEAPIRFILNKNLANRQLQKNDLVIEMSGGTPTQSTGRCVLINDELLRYSELPYICSNFCKTIKPSNGYATFLYATLQDFMQKGIFFKYENSSNGIQNLDLEALSKEEGIIIAPINLIAEFSKHYNSISLIQMRLGHEISKLQNLTKALL